MSVEASPDPADGGPSGARRRHGAVVIVFGSTLCVVYTALFWVQWPRAWFPTFYETLTKPMHSISRAVSAALEWIGLTSTPFELRTAIYLLATGVAMPWLAMAICGRARPSDLGLRRPNRHGWRIILVGYVIALPFLIWMVQEPEFAGPYLRQLRRTGAALFLGYYLVNMLCEHFFLHGILLAAARPDGRWPEPPPVNASGARGPARMLRWVGLAGPVEGVSGTRKATAWLGLPRGCAAAILVSGALFGLIHLGKAPRELLLSVPGGVVEAYIAYRANSWLVPFLLHMTTAGTACAMIVWLS